MITYLVIFVLLWGLELAYFTIADHFNIIDKPNERSSHSTIVLRGGGIIFLIGLWIWSMFFGFHYPWFLIAVTVVAGISFIDDIHSLPDSIRLVCQLLSMLLIFYQVGLFQWELWWVVPIALFLSVGATNLYNFMDGINGITGGYSLAILIPLLIKNEELRSENGVGFVEESLLIVVGLSLLVFCFFNFRTKAKCFAGDVGSVGIALIMVFCVSRLMFVTGDPTWIVLFILYSVDGTMTIIHRIMLHEHLGEAHRKHAYQLMANELKMKHTTVSCIYMCIQLAISLIAIYLIPDTLFAHWIYFIAVCIVLGLAYIVFMKKYYHLHEAYLLKLRMKNEG